MASGGSWWPSLGWASLPSFDSFTTRHWQRRLLRYLIKRTLAGFLRIPEDDIEQSTYLDADLGSGSLRLRDVELDEEAINQILRKQLGTDGPTSSVDVRLLSSHLSSVQILVGSSDTADNNHHASGQPARQISATERLFTAPIHFVASDISLKLRVDPSTPAPDSPDVLREQDEGAVHATLDLGASILHVAEDYIHDEEPEVDTLQDAIDEPFGLPGGFDVPGNNNSPQPTLSQQQQVGLIAQVIETLLERLRISVSNITIDLELGDDLQVQVRISRLETGTEVKTVSQSRSQTRTLEVEGFGIYRIRNGASLSTPTEAVSVVEPPTSRTNSSAASTGSSDDLAMSMAIADLRVSQTEQQPGKESDMMEASSYADSLGRSVYVDADEAEDDDDDTQADTAATNEQQCDHSSSSSGHRENDTPTCEMPINDPEEQIFGLFSELAGDSRLARLTLRHITTFSLATSASAPERTTLTSLTPSQAESTRIEVVAPVLAMTVDAAFTKAVLTFLSRLSLSSSSPATSPQQVEKRASTLLHARINALHVFCHFDEASQSLSDLLKVFASPVTTSPLPKCIYMFCKTMEGVYSLDGRNAKLAIHDLGLCTSQQGSLRPVALPDPGLIWQYDPEVHRPGQQSPSFGDWKSKRSNDLQDWRCGLPIGASSLTASTHLPMLKDALAIRLTQNEIKMNMQPLHVWLDIEELDSLTADFLHTGILESYTPTRAPASAQRTMHSVKPYRSATGQIIIITIPCLRLDLRCPTLPSAEHPNYGDLRSGLVTVALHDVTYHGGSFPQDARKPGPVPSSGGFSLAHVYLMLARPGDSHMRSILYAGWKAHQLPAPIKLHFYGQDTGSDFQDGLKIQVPFAEVALAKEDIDAIQYLVDDVARIAARFAHIASKSQGSAEYSGPAGVSASDTEQSPRSLSSSCYTPSASSSQSEASLAEADIGVGEVKFRLLLSSKVDIPGSRSVEGEIRSLSVIAGLRKNDKDDFIVTTTLDELAITDRLQSTGGVLVKPIVQRSATSQLPALKFRLVSSVDDRSRKHSRLSLRLWSILVTLSSDTTLFDELGALFKVPTGAFLDIAPTETTKVNVEADDMTVKLIARTLPSAIALSVGKLGLETKLKYKCASTKWVGHMENLQAWVADAPRDQQDRRPDMKVRYQSIQNSRLAKIFMLQDMGYAQLLFCKGLSTNCKIRNESNNTIALLAALNTAHISVCPDSVTCLAAFAANFLPEPTIAAKTESHTLAAMSESVILPRQSILRTRDNEGLISKEGEPVSLIDGETIQIFGQEKIEIDRDWMRKSSMDLYQSKASNPPTLSLKVKPSDVTISFFEGYDFDKTRKFIKSTVKATRRKLEKIKQILAEGQMPEQTIEEAADPLLQSIFLPPRPARRSQTQGGEGNLPESAEEADTLSRIVAFDDELDQDDEYDSDSLLMWETLRDRPPAPRRGSSSSSRIPMSRPSRSSRLKRPRISAIDVKLAGLELDLQTFKVDAPMASRLLVRVKDLSIVDNLKTSTWNKFLTELRPRDGGITRPSGSSMVRILLKMMRSGGSGTEEADLSVKVAPLRLHVDQDALDFFKAFFAFKMELESPSTDSQAVPAAQQVAQNSGGEGGFVQRVEIAAIKIKLDYKPKRVDYRALRQGRAIEMMNFFHFEASEMVLRHLVLSGVPSWAKVGDMLQEIWTPDVKANQLADFLSGINPVRSVVNVGHGVADLVLLPVAQYRKDGRLAKGLQRGGTRFAKSTAMEAIKLGARLATGTQVILEHAEHVLGGRIDAPSSSSGVGRSALPMSAEGQSRSEWLLTATEDMEEEDEEEQAGFEPLSRFSQQPEDVRVGLQTAYKSLSGNVRSAAETILAVPMEVYERSSEGPVRAVVRAVPIAVLKPMIGASEAVSKTLLGLRNTLDPGAKDEVQDKYKRRSNTR